MCLVISFCHVSPQSLLVISFNHFTCAFPLSCTPSPVTSLQYLVSRFPHTRCQILTVIPVLRLVLSSLFPYLLTIVIFHVFFFPSIYFIVELFVFRLSRAFCLYLNKSSFYVKIYLHPGPTFTSKPHHSNPS